jgi:hypothetical protein
VQGVDAEQLDVPVVEGDAGDRDALAGEVRGGAGLRLGVGPAEGQRQVGGVAVGGGGDDLVGAARRLAGGAGDPDDVATEVLERAQRRHVDDDVGVR